MDSSQQQPIHEDVAPTLDDSDSRPLSNQNRKITKTKPIQKAPIKKSQSIRKT